MIWLVGMRIWTLYVPEIAISLLKGVLEIRIEVFEAQSGYDSQEKPTCCRELVPIVDNAFPQALPDVCERGHDRGGRRVSIAIMVDVLTLARLF